jgi:hypothetical protein
LFSLDFVHYFSFLFLLPSGYHGCWEAGELGLCKKKKIGLYTVAWAKLTSYTLGIGDIERRIW